MAPLTKVASAPPPIPATHAPPIAPGTLCTWIRSGKATYEVRVLTLSECGRYARVTTEKGELTHPKWDWLVATSDLVPLSKQL